MDGYQSYHKFLRYFLKAFGLLIVIMFGNWLHKTMDGGSLKGFNKVNLRKFNPQEHAIFMMIFYVMVAFMILSPCNICNNFSWFHVKRSLIMVFMIIIGIRAAHDHNGKGEWGAGVHFQSFHSRLAMLAIVIFILVFLIGHVMLLLPHAYRRELGFDYDHKYFTLALFILLTLIVQLGMYSISRFNLGQGFNYLPEFKDNRADNLLLIKALVLIFAELVCAMSIVNPLCWCNEDHDESEYNLTSTSGSSASA